MKSRFLPTLSGGRAVIAAASAAAVLSCSFLVDVKSDQCAADGDCRRFSERPRCEVAQRVCVAVASLEAGSDSAIEAQDRDGSPQLDAGECGNPNKPLVSLTDDVTDDFTFTCEKDYLIQGVVNVTAGVTITIAPGTTFKGDLATRGTLVIQPGARIQAVGTQSRPIVFTSSVEPQSRLPGDWGGLVLLGKATHNGGAETLPIAGAYGGSEDGDSSGTLKYVRIEYAGQADAADARVKLPGLTLAGVGSGTTIDFVQVRIVDGDCFGFFGGAASGKHLFCRQSGDDGFDWTNGYHGKLQFLVVQRPLQAPTHTGGESDALEGDNDLSGSSRAPISEPQIYNATLIGQNVVGSKEQYALLLQRGSKAHLFNSVAIGWDAGLDLRGGTTAQHTSTSGIEARGNILFGNLTHNVAYPEAQAGTGPTLDDDGAFDERNWFLNGALKNLEASPGLVAPFDPAVPRMYPQVSLTFNAVPLPADGFFDTSAAFVGAFRDASDDWVSGGWATFEDK